MAVTAFQDLPLADRERSGTAPPPRSMYAAGRAPRTNPTPRWTTPLPGWGARYSAPSKLISSTTESATSSTSDVTTSG
jgi:hypothetical protein